MFRVYTCRDLGFRVHGFTPLGLRVYDLGIGDFYII